MVAVVEAQVAMAQVVEEAMAAAVAVEDTVVVVMEEAVVVADLETVEVEAKTPPWVVLYEPLTGETCLPLRRTSSTQVHLC